jgi:hypothetical protein
MNMTLTEGRIVDKMLLEEMSLDEYYAELKSYIQMRQNEAAAYEKARQKAESAAHRKSKR